MALLYDNNWSLRSLRELLHMVGTQVGWVDPLCMLPTQEGAGLSLVTRQLEEDGEEGYRATLREVKASNGKQQSPSGERHGRPPHCACLQQGHPLGGAQPGSADRAGHPTGGIHTSPLLSFQFNWILTNLDAHTVDFRPFKYDFTNFTLLRLLDFSRPFVQHSLRSIVTEVSSVSPCLHPCLHQGDHHGPNT